MLVLVRQILEIGSDRLLTLLTPVGEQVLVAPNAERLVVSKDVAMSGEIQRTVEARQRTDALYRDALYRLLHHSPTGVRNSVQQSGGGRRSESPCTLR